MHWFWDYDGIDNTSDKLRLYVNGEIGLTSNSATLANAAQTNIRLGNNDNNNGYANGVIDNFKVYNYAKTDFSDRNIEQISNTKDVRI